MRQLTYGSVAISHKLFRHANHIQAATLFHRRALHQGELEILDEEKVPSSARIVVAGGGVIGSSIAYHLSKRCALGDVLLLDQGKLASGSTWTSTGLIPSFKGASLIFNFGHYAKETFGILHQETGIDPHFRGCGSLYLARSEDRMIFFRKIYAQYKANKFISEQNKVMFVDPDTIGQDFPLIKIEGLKGGVYVNQDGVVDPTALTQAYAKGAMIRGARVMERTKVLKVRLNEAEKVSGVETSRGLIHCDIFVNAAGMWANDLGQSCDIPVRVPIHPFSHIYITTKPCGIHPSFPVTRDFDGRLYFRESNGGLLIGGFELNTKPVFNSGVPDKFEFTRLPDDWQQFHPTLESAVERIAGLDEMQIESMINTAEAGTPDGLPLFGEVPHVKDYFIAAGMCTLSVQLSATAGRDMADWILDGHPKCNLWSCDIQRFNNSHCNRNFLRERIKETCPGLYEIPYPRSNPYTARGLIHSPLHPRLERVGAVFGQSAGYERAHCYAIYQLDFESIRSIKRGTFSKPGWFDLVRAEYFNTKQNVSLIDMSSFVKVEVHGPGATEFLQSICCVNIKVPFGQIIHSGILNQNGGYEIDFMIVAIGVDHYLIIGPTISRTKLPALLRRHIASRDVFSRISVDDITTKWAAINLIGPNAVSVLSDLVNTPLDNTSFKPFTLRDMDVAFASGVRVLHMTHCGEPGFLLHVKADQALHLYDALMEAGKEFQIGNTGYYALRSMRVEKFMPFWGQDFNFLDNPFEIGRESRLTLDSDLDFIGKEALLNIRNQGTFKKLFMFMVEDHDPSRDMWFSGGEPIYLAKRAVGSVSSATYSYSLDRQLLIGWLTLPDPAKSAEWSRLIKSNVFHIDLAGTLYRSKARLLPPILPSANTSQVFAKVRTLASQHETRYASILI